MSGKFPRYYVQKYDVNNLYKFNLDSRTRLIYTSVADDSGVVVVFWRFWITRSMKKDSVIAKLCLSKSDTFFE